MKKRFRDLIDHIEYDDLLRIKDDLEKGGEKVSILIENAIKAEHKKHNRFCTVCSNKLEPESTTNFTLLFGPEGLRKKASFCAMDCLEYFIKALKEMKAKKAKHNK